MREVIRAVVFREGELSSGAVSSPPAPTSSPHTEPDPAPAQQPDHPLAAESRAAQAAFEAQMKSFYNNPFASQLLAASTKMFSGNFDLNPFLGTAVKQEAPDDENFDDAEEAAAEKRARRLSRADSEAERSNQPVDLATNKSIDAIASKLVSTAEHESKSQQQQPLATAQSPAAEINDNVYNCSDEIRKTMKSASDLLLLPPCSQERKSV